MWAIAIAEDQGDDRSAVVAARHEFVDHGIEIAVETRVVVVAGVAEGDLEQAQVRRGAGRLGRAGEPPRRRVDRQGAGGVVDELAAGRLQGGASPHRSALQPVRSVSRRRWNSSRARRRVAARSSSGKIRSTTSSHRWWMRYQPSASPLTSGTWAASDSRRASTSGSNPPSPDPATQPTSLAVPQPSVARASRRRCSAADRPATISSHRNCGAEPSGAEMARRTSDGHPAKRPRPSSLPSVAAQRSGERVDLGGREGEVVDADVDHLASGPTTVEGDRWCGSSGEDEVGVRWQSGDELAEQLGSGRAGGSSWTSSITTQTSIGASSTDCVEDPLRRFAAFTAPAEGGDDRRRQVLGVAVGGLARQARRRCHAGRRGWRESPGRAASTCRTRRRRRSPSAGPGSVG